MSNPKFVVAQEWRVGGFNPEGKESIEIPTEVYLDMAAAKARAKELQQEKGGFWVVAEYATKVVAQYGKVKKAEE